MCATCVRTPHPSEHGCPTVEIVKSEAQMVRVELDTVIARPIDDVFRRLIDLPDYSRWR
jgi:hypothetical protein